MHSQQNQTASGRSHPYIMGIITGASLAVAAMTMMGQTYDKKPGTAAPTTKMPPAASEPVQQPMPPIDVDQYFATPGNESNSTARMWRRPAGKSHLEFIGEFQASLRGR